MRILAIATLSLGLAGCGTEQPAAEPQPAGNEQIAETGGAATHSASAEMRSAGGDARGSATLAQEGDGIAVRLTAANLQPGTYAVHIHTTGRCDPPAFESAGSHWNPAQRQHGRDNPQGAHKGDLPNLTVAAVGSGSLEFTVPAVSIRDGATPLLDSDGAALMIHEKADDYRTDPTGNAGARIACGVIG